MKRVYLDIQRQFYLPVFLVYIFQLNICNANELTKYLPDNIAFNSNVSISPFPYDLSLSAVKQVADFVARSGNIYTVQLDNGIPWQAALDEDVFSSAMMGEWRQQLNSISPEQEVYLAIAPLQDDRISWAAEFEGEKAPEWVRNENKLNEKILNAYRNYVIRAVQYFKPAYVNIGVEAGDVAAKKPDKWPSMEKLFTQTIKSVKAINPDIKVGISWGLPLLMKTDVIDRSAVLIDRLDYVGISFYPYLAQFYQKIGGVELPQPPDQWRMPFEWLRNNLEKPVAICETAYSSNTVKLPGYGLNMHSSSALQSQYVKELADIAISDEYLFTVFFLAVDYELLMDKLGIAEMALWRNTGLFSSDLVPKPSWIAYKENWLDDDNDNLQSKITLREKQVKKLAGSEKPKIDINSESIIYSINFDSEKELFESENRISLSPINAMQWTYEHRRNEWAWSLKKIKKGNLSGSESIILLIRSDYPGDIYVQLQESSGESFYKIIKVDNQWNRIELKLSSFSLDSETAVDNILSVQSVESIMLAVEPEAQDCCGDMRQIEVLQIVFVK